MPDRKKNVPTQSAWRRYDEAFDIVPDQTPWSGEYIKRGDNWEPVRENFKNPNGARFGLIERDAGSSLFQKHGIYLLGRDKKVIYVGRGAPSESIGSRLSKHHLKFTASRFPGIYHPARWRSYIQQQFKNGIDLTDMVRSIQFSYFELSDKVSFDDAEAEVFSEVTLRQKNAPELNSDGSIKRDHHKLGLQVRLPN